MQHAADHDGMRVSLDDILDLAVECRQRADQQRDASCVLAPFGTGETLGVKGAERFAGAEWRKHATGVPLLVGALAAFDCEVEDIIERHSHAIVIGRVLHVEAASPAAALAYWQGDYLTVDRDQD